jgi:hypothetical protein
MRTGQTPRERQQFWRGFVLGMVTLFVAILGGFLLMDYFGT